MQRTCMGYLARLVDDVVLKILCLCNIIDLLHIEQTCKYLRLLATHREIWHAVLLRLPRELAPSILPNQKREESNCRDLALRALRGDKNWTSNHPKPLWRLPLSLKHSDCMLTSPSLIPGGKYLLYFKDNTLFCFDVERNDYILERRNSFPELLDSAHELLADGKTLCMCLIGQAHVESAIVVHLELLEINLENGQYELISEFTQPWSELHRTAGGEYMMLRSPSLRGRGIMIPYIAGDYVGTPSRGAMIVNFVDNSVILASLQDCDDTSTDHDSPINFTSNHLLYISGRGSQNLIIHSVPLDLFKGCRKRFDDATNCSRCDVQPAHSDSRWHINLPSLTPPFRSHILVHDSNWIDLEKARLTDPSVMSLSLLDVQLIWKEDERISDIQSRWSWRYYHLQFTERTDAYSERSSGMFVFDEVTGMSKHVDVPNARIRPDDQLSRSGRLVVNVETGTLQNKWQAMAVQVNLPSFRPMEHLAQKLVRHFILESYTGTVLHSSQRRDPVTLKPIAGSTEVVIEGYDGSLPHSCTCGSHAFITSGPREDSLLVTNSK